MASNGLLTFCGLPFIQDGGADVTGIRVPPYFGSGGTHMPRQLGPPPGPKCLAYGSGSLFVHPGILVRVGGGGGGGGGTEFSDTFYLLPPPVLIR